MKELIDQLLAARAVSTPLLAVTTPDQPALTQIIIEKLNGDTPVVKWDRSRGLVGGNDNGREALQALCKVFSEELNPSNIEAATADPAAMVRFALGRMCSRFSVSTALASARQ